MKVGDVVRLDPAYNHGKWSNAPALIVDSGRTVASSRGPIKFLAVMCNGEVFETPAWSLIGTEV